MFRRTPIEEGEEGEGEERGGREGGSSGPQWHYTNTCQKINALECGLQDLA